jgi:hypothetical protein
VYASRKTLCGLVLEAAGHQYYFPSSHERSKEWAGDGCILSCRVGPPPEIPKLLIVLFDTMRFFSLNEA